MMSRPIKRDLAQEMSYVGYNSTTETQDNMTTPHAKRRRRRLEENDSIGAIPGPLTVPEDTFLSNTFGIANPQSAFTDIFEPGYGTAWHDKGDWGFDIQAGISNLPFSFIAPNHLGASSHEFSNVWDPGLAYGDAAATYSDLRMATDPTCDIPSLLTSDQDTQNGILYQGVGAFDLTSNHHHWSPGFDDLSSIGIVDGEQSYGHQDPSIVLYEPGQCDAINEPDCLSSILDGAANLPLHSDTTFFTEAQLDEHIYAGLFSEAEGIFPPHTHVLPSKPQNSISPLMVMEHATDSRPQVNHREKLYRNILPLPLDKDHIVSPGNLPTSHISHLFHGHNNKFLTLEGRPRLGRSKPLEPETARGANQMREVIACLACRYRKLKCSPGVKCDKCKPLHAGPCMRFDLKYYTNYFFPSIVNSSYKDSVVENFIRDNVVPGISAHEVMVQISSGPAYEPITLFVHEFQPTNDDFLALPQIKTDQDGNLSSEFTCQYAPPFVISHSTNRLLKEKCLEHVESIAKGPRYSGEVYYKDISIVSWEVFNAITQYQRAANSELARQAIVLYAMHYFMSQNLVFTDDSADAAIKSLNGPTRLPYTPTLASKLITLQIKQAMYDLVHDKTRVLLKDLERAMNAPKSTPKTIWAALFCVISVLCMCAEMVQSATDLKAVHMMREEGFAKLTRAESMDECRELPISHFIKLFHLFSRSYQQNGAKKNERGFNPIRDGLEDGREKGLNAPTIDLINEIRRTVAEHGDEIGDRVKELPLDHDPDDLSDLLARHLTFREKNSGKLVSRFLLSFLQYN